MNTEAIAELQSAQAFEAVDLMSLRKIAEGAFFHQLPQGLTLFSEGAPPEFVFVLLDGTVQAISHLGQNDATLAIIRPIALLGASDVVLERAFRQTVRTISRMAKVIMLRSENIMAALRTDPQFALAFTRFIAEEANALAYDLKVQKTLNATERLARWVLDNITDDEMQLPFSKYMLASIVGSRPESLSRSIATLEKHGLVVDGHQVRIVDRAALELIALGSPRTPL